MSTVSHVQAATVAEPVATPRRRTRARRRRATARGGILWITVGGILLAGVVFVNVAGLQLNLRLEKANAQKAKLIAENASLQTQYSRLMSSPRIYAVVTKRFGLRYEDPSQYGYIDLAKK